MILGGPHVDDLDGTASRSSSSRAPVSPASISCRARRRRRIGPTEGKGASQMASTATSDPTPPATVTGSWPRPRWYDVRARRACPSSRILKDVPGSASSSPTRSRSSSRRAGTGRARHPHGRGNSSTTRTSGGQTWLSYPLQRWAGLDPASPDEDEAPSFSRIRSVRSSTEVVGGTLAAGCREGRARSEEAARVRQDLAARAAERGLRQAGQVREVSSRA